MTIAEIMIAIFLFGNKNFNITHRTKVDNAVLFMSPVW